jgi:Raf kinase inhibitor-like YbhB/YbcL family protein
LGIGNCSSCFACFVFGSKVVTEGEKTREAKKSGWAEKIEISHIENMLKVTSSVFENGGEIPSRYTCDGNDINPPLTVESIPDTAKSLVLIVDDPDAPMGVWDHWIVFNILVNGPSFELLENVSLKNFFSIKNSFGKVEYGGPCPPSGVHRYFFRVYALDVVLDLSSDSNREELEDAMEGHILDQGELMGKYERK